MSSDGGEPGPGEDGRGEVGGRARGEVPDSGGWEAIVSHRDSSLCSRLLQSAALLSFCFGRMTFLRDRFSFRDGTW